MINKSICILVATILLVSSGAKASDSVRLLNKASNIATAIESARVIDGVLLSGSLPQPDSWLLVQLENPNTSIFHFPAHSVTSYSVYSLKTGFLLETFVSPFQSATYIDWTPNFTLSLDRAWGDEFLVDLSMQSNSEIPYTLMSFQAYQRLVSDQLISSGVFYGAIALMALFSFLLYILNADKHAGRLSFSFIIWLLTMLSVWGFGESPMPLGLSDVLPDLANKLTILGAIAGAWFTAYFLRKNILESFVYKALYFWIWVQVSFFLASFFIEPPWVAIILLNICSGILCLGSCILASARGDTAAKFLSGSSLLVSFPFFFIFFSPLNQQTIIAVGMGSLVLVMLALLTRMAEKTQSLSMKAELSSERERFLTSLSHEIRTPLNGIIGFSELVNQENLEGKVKTYFGLIDRSSKVLLGIVNEVLDYAKLQTAEITPNLAPLNIQKTLEDVITINRPTATNNGIGLSFEIDDSLPDYVTTDPQRCLQILINLCGNAVKFSKDSSVIIRACRENSLLVFEVIDNGIGIQQDVLAGLFNPFKQADASTARQFGGTGLGLAISKQLCELLGGNLNAVSEYGKGSTFTFSIPLVEALQPEANIEVSGDLLNGKKILIAEDNVINLMLATQILKRHGLKIDTAEDGKRALAKASEKGYDFILMDMQMPKLSGTETTAEIRNRGITTPIIAMTANTSESDREACIASGMNDYLSKPIAQQLLLKKLILWSKPR